MITNAIRIMGVDPAKMRDAFGLTVLDITEDMVHVMACKQWFRTEYLKVESEIRDIVARLKIQKVFLEINNTGTHVFELLKKYQVPIYPIVTVSKVTDYKKIHSGRVMSKADIVGFTLKLLQEGRLKFPRAKSKDMTELIRQFQTFQESITPAGTPTYSGPSNMHDDLVMSLLIAIHGARRWIKNTRHPLSMSLSPNPIGYE